MTTTHAIALLLILAGSLGLLVGLAVLLIGRGRGTHDPDSTDDPAETDPAGIELGELLEPRTNVIPIIRPAARRAGRYFEHYNGPLTPEPEEPYRPGESS